MTLVRSFDSVAAATDLEAPRLYLVSMGFPGLIAVGIPAEAGSPYGSSQRLAGAPPTRADDIYSLAAITLELLIGTPADPNEDMSPALREAQGLPERRRIQRPAPHETRVFTSIAGVDAGKLRAAFSEEPSERPSTAAAFVARFQDAISNTRETGEPARSVVAVPSVSDEHEAPLPAPVLDTKRSEDVATLELPSRDERVVAESRPTTPAVSQTLVRKSHEHQSRKRKRKRRLARPEPIVAVQLVSEITPARASSIDEASQRSPVQSGSRALLVAAVVGVSFGAGFGGGFMVGQGSTPSSASREASHDEPLAAPQLTRAAVEDPEPIASTTPTVAPISEEKASSSEPIAATVARQRAVPVVESGRLLVRSTPAGASVVVDGQSRGVTPLALRELALGAHTIEVLHSGHDTRRDVEQTASGTIG